MSPLCDQRPLWFGASGFGPPSAPSAPSGGRITGSARLAHVGEELMCVASWDLLPCWMFILLAGPGPAFANAGLGNMWPVAHVRPAESFDLATMGGT